MAADYVTVPRDPGQPPRARLFMDRVAGVLNSLLRRGSIVQTDVREYALRPASDDASAVIANQVFGG